MTVSKVYEILNALSCNSGGEKEEHRMRSRQVCDSHGNLKSFVNITKAHRVYEEVPSVQKSALQCELILI